MIIIEVEIVSHQVRKALITIVKKKENDVSGLNRSEFVLPGCIPASMGVEEEVPLD